LSDTVGFISELPTLLVAAFRATLEEVIEADIILHVRDVSHGDAEAQSLDVTDVLRQLGIEPGDSRLVEVWNKVDRLDAGERERTLNLAARQTEEHPVVVVSALTGEGTDQLIGLIEERLAQTRITLDLVLDGADGAGLSWLYRNAEVLAKNTDDDGRMAVTVRADPAKANIVRTKFGLATAPIAGD
jgi:GTP-binding protein HflX